MVHTVPYYIVRFVVLKFVHSTYHVRPREFTSSTMVLRQRLKKLKMSNSMNPMPHGLSDGSVVFKAQFLAGLVERAIVYPYDVLKTRQQLVLPLRFFIFLLIFSFFSNFIFNFIESSWIKIHNFLFFAIFCPYIVFSKI